MDGTLIDSDPVHEAVFIDMLADYGISLGENEYAEKIHGRRNEEVFAELLPGSDADNLHVEKEARFRDRIGEIDAPIAGSVALIERARDAGLLTAVVTNGCRDNLEAVMDHFDMRRLFNANVSADDVENGKPAPDVYLHALDLLGVDARGGMAFEDSPAGLESAKAAGLRIIGIMSSLSEEALKSHGAIYTIRDYTDPGLDQYVLRPA